MKYSLQKRISAFVLAFALVMTTAFNSIGATTKADAAAKVKALYLTSKTATLTVGQTGTAKFGVRATKATKAMAKVTVKSSDTSVVKVGKITTKAAKKTAKAAKKSLSTVKYSALKAGTATITITTKKKTKKTKKFKVTVKEAATTQAPAVATTTQASADATTALPADVKVESLLLDKSEASIMVGDSVTLTATKTPAAAVTPVTWTSSDTKVATVKDGVVTGVAVGTATITAEADGKKAEAKITVNKKEIVAALVDAKQASANTVTIAFDIPEAKDVVAKNDIKITNVSANAVAGINTLAFDASGKVATATLTSNLTNGASYTVEYKGVTKEFVASVGDVASIAIETENAELNTATPVKFKLLDNTGMDVTSTIAVDSRVTITATGTSSESLTPASKATITLGNVGDKAEVTVTYDKGDGKSDLVTVTKTITCIPASAKVGTGVFYVSTGAADIDAKSGCAKFYNGLKSNIVNVIAGGPSSATVYFYADASADGAISYDSYEVSTVDADIAAVNGGKLTGKFCTFDVTGYTKGQTFVKIKATKNDATTEYQVPVSVAEYGKISGVSISGNRELTNAKDSDYYTTLEATATFSGGEKTLVDYTWEVTSTVVDLAGAPLSTADLLSDTTGSKIKANMWGVGSKEYTVKVTATDANMNETSRTLTITNKKLKDGFWAADDTASITYDLETTNADFKISNLKTAFPTYRVIAKSGGLFAGYVDADGTIGDSAPAFTGPAGTTEAAGITPDAAFAITTIEARVSTTGTTAGKTIEITGAGVAKLKTAGEVSLAAGSTVKLDPYADSTDLADTVVDFTKPANCTFVSGTYKVEFIYSTASVTDKVLSKTFSFKNDFATPDVSPSKKTVKTVKEIFKTKYDLNNDDVENNGTISNAFTTVAAGPSWAIVASGDNAAKAQLQTNALTGATSITYVVTCNGGKITIE